jgi:hypothetical protein
LAINSSNTNREKNKMICMRFKIRVLHKAYKQLFELLYSIIMPRLVKIRVNSHKRPQRDNKPLAMS